MGSWIRGLKDDKNEIFRAAKDANLAADFLLTLEREKSVAKALEVIEAQPNQRAPGRATESGTETSAHSRRFQEKHQTARGSSNATALDPSFAEVKALSARALGENTRVYKAQADSGIYRGEIIGETQNYVVQKLGQQSTVAHMKQLLNPVPSVGQNVAVRYSRGKIIEVAAFQPKAQAKEITR